ncbi:MAG: hypothetical protein HGJ94_12220 [Desulfosarcina sp.]|nr:hypothetical protein [Desulfosarcina sp.]MBC2741621.1 hypothetical protein [Desulfosarcina sp.]MBC2764535.1 hypothetical protein [Desulfosarcina sp.]
MRTKRGILIVALALAAVVVWSTASIAAVDRVLCVPWEGNPNSHHTAISGQAVNLNAVIYGDATGGTFSYSWEFKDFSPPTTGTISIPANGIYNLQVAHTFTGALGATFDTELTIEGITDVYNIVIAPDNYDAKVNIAIDKGLWYLHTQMLRTNVGHNTVPGGYWNDNSWYVGRTGASVWAFEVQGHLLTVEADPLNPVEDPYVENVQRGINYLLAQTRYQTMNPQTYGHPEDYDGDGAGDGNGIGLVCYHSVNHTNYEQGLAMGAIAGSGDPAAVAATGGSYVLGRTYAQIVQDMVDWYAWSQIDDPLFPPNDARGGWYYTANANYQHGTYGDNSASQWAYIGLDAAVANFGSNVPQWMKEQLAGYLHSQIIYRGGSVSYRANYGPNAYNDNVCLTGGALVGMALVGETIYDIINGSGAFDADQSSIESVLGTNWHGTISRWKENWYGHRAYYTMYSVMKGFRLTGIESLPGSPGTTNWYADYVSVMIPDQHPDGHWRGTGWMDGYIREDMGTAFGVLILTPSPFSPPPEACFDAEPNPSYLDIPITFDPACSYHRNSERNIVLYEWDWNNDGTYDTSSVTPDIQTHVWPSSEFGLGAYPVTLRVTDDTEPVPVTDTYVLTINLTTPPHPPVAVAGGPYMVSLCEGDTLTLDGSASWDINTGQSESGNPPYDAIMSWAWDLGGAPWDYADASGETVTVNPSDFLSVGANSIGLKVTDNTVNAFPGSGQEDLTDEDFTTVTVFDNCGSCDLYARAKSGKVQLTWAHSGADSYDVYRSTEGPNTGFTLIADDHVTTYATYLDTDVVNGITYYYRVVDSDGCGSAAVSATPIARPTRTR